MYVQVDAGDTDAASVLTHVPGVTRVVESDRRDGMVGYEVDSETGRDVRRDLARAVVTSGLGTARAAPDAHEPRGRLPVADDGRNCRPRSPRMWPPQKRLPMRNIVTIASKELKSYFASPVGWILLGFWSLLYGYFFVAILNFFVRAEHADEPVRHAGAAGHERQPAADPAAGRAEPADSRPVPAAGGDDADLLRGEAVGNDRAAAHLAAHRLPDHHGQVSRRDGALRRRCSPSR